MLQAGSLFAQDFRIVRPLSEGGMGSVFVAEQLSTGAQRALKIIRPELVGDARLRARFEQEARVTSRISSDHVVSVVAAGIDGPTQVPWLAMELLQGQTMADALASRGPMSPGDFAELFTQLCHAMSAAHAVSVVHRDLKPENIFLAESRRAGMPFFVKVLDFGIARVMAEIKVSRTDALGTPLWMSPEQTSAGANIGPWTDIWPLGLIAFYALTGRNYWLAASNVESTMGVLREVVMEPLAPASARAAQLGVAERLPPGFDAWFAQCVEREPSRRFPSVAAARDALLPLLQAVASQRSAQMTILPQTAPTALGLGSAAYTPSHAGRSGGTPAGLPGGGTLAAGPNWSPYQGAQGGGQGTTGAPVAGTGPGASRPSGTSKAPIFVAVGLVAVLVMGGATAYIARTYSQKKAAADCRDSSVAAARRIEACTAQCKASAQDDACHLQGELMLASGSDAHAAEGIEVLRTACNSGSSKACGALGSALAFPPRASLKPDLKQAVAYLDKGCAADPAQCATLGVGKELGWEGIKDDALSYYQRACDAGEGLGCAYAAARVARQTDPTSVRRTADLKTKAVALLTPQCQAKSGDACAALGLVSDSEVEAVKSFRAACDAGNALGCNNLGRATVEGKGGVAASPTDAMDLFKKACDGGEVAGCNNMGTLQANLPVVHRTGPRGADVYKFFCTGAFHAGCAGWGKPMNLGLGGTKNLSDAVASFEKACDAGLLVACVNQGAMSLVGEGIARDRMRAQDLFTKACEGGDPGGCGESAALFLQDRVQQPRDDHKGFTLMQKACEGGELDACVNVYTLDIYGRGGPGKEADGWANLQSLCTSERSACSAVADLYLEGLGTIVPKKPAEARKLYEEVCDAGAGSGCNSFGYVLLQGLGGPRDNAKALTIMRSACEQDDFDSCVNLGFLHMDGVAGVPKDLAKGNDYFEKGCKMGHAKSCNALSHSYVAGDGVGKDVGRAASLAHEACEGAYASGCGTYGIMMAEGMAGPKDVGAAKAFLDVACRGDIKEACDELKAQGLPLPSKL